LPIYSRERFVEEIFYPEVYVEGTLCVGFNLPFDLARIAIYAGLGETRTVASFASFFHAAYAGTISGSNRFRDEPHSLRSSRSES
jgi:hypothetical protein